ncbi:cutinase-domain-containing protein [Colletotrichum godetiae]|uniref:Cutinase-domain-containing protein n=1 Tax=Colletotrichum godetiae TaxID=1209918 RepID=A0AAJ0ESQ8_9PEZI|nr:cutinase-domain-containing protein [Colletotrichum godetiae]KAK1659748.1 cutinase-domain-containing protein [Colletotrichum godetiae]
MFFIKLVALSALSLSVVHGQGTDDCPELPETGVTIGDPVPIRPEDIPAGCSDFEILVARGTSEPNFVGGGGKFGIIVGDPVVSNTTVALPGARGYPVQYPASSQIITGVRQGSRDVVNRLKSQAAACPNQNFSLVGYSQGAAVMHAAAADIPAELYGRIKSLVMFGDGYLKLGASLSKFPAGLDEKVRQVCAAGDPVCDASGTCTFFHLTYIRPEFIDPAVDFIVQKFTQ